MVTGTWLTSQRPGSEKVKFIQYRLQHRLQGQTAWVPVSALPLVSQVTLGEVTLPLGASVSSSEIGTIVPDLGLFPGLNESMYRKCSALIINITDALFCVVVFRWALPF